MRCMDWRARCGLEALVAVHVGRDYDSDDILLDPMMFK